MKNKFVHLMAGLVALLVFQPTASAQQLTSQDQQNLDLIHSDNPKNWARAARNVHGFGQAALVVTDALAENLLQNQNINGRILVDGMAWTCKALAITGNRRYYDAIRSVHKNKKAHEKLRDHCDESADSLKKAEGEQYRQGMYALTRTTAPANTAQTLQKNESRRLKP